MSIFKDVDLMHVYFGQGKPKGDDLEQLNKLLKDRYLCMQEEMAELLLAIKRKQGEEIVDALTDLIVFAAGTMDILGIDGEEAWREVMRANMAKEPYKSERMDNDLRKPEGWAAPSHEGNHGVLAVYE